MALMASLFRDMYKSSEYLVEVKRKDLCSRLSSLEQHTVPEVTPDLDYLNHNVSFQ